MPTSIYIKSKATLGILAMAALLTTVISIDSAKADKPGQGFSNRSLHGSYASSGRAGGYLSRSVGVTWFDGNGRVKRVVTINTSDGAQGELWGQPLS